MSPVLLLSIIVIYFSVILGIAFYTGRHATNESFFIGNRNSKWWLVAFGMIGTSLSGMTFISVPGTVGAQGFNYFQVVIGYFIGYFVVAYILLPLYYKLNLTSIYTYLEARFGPTAYKTGALFFILSRTLGATLRLYLVIKVLEKFVLQDLGISFEVTTVIILLLILLYTFKGGVKTIVWTDTLQTTFMLLALVICIGYILTDAHLNIGQAWDTLVANHYTQMWQTSNPLAANYFLKQIVGGAFITIAMTGLDQEMMQKNISVSNLPDARKNMLTLSLLQMIVVFIFLFLGGMLFIYFSQHGGDIIHVMDGKGGLQFMMQQNEVKSDDMFPILALRHMPGYIGIIFIIGLISALFPSADGALTALTSSYCIDIYGITKRTDKSPQQQQQVRQVVHYSFAIIFLVFVFLFRYIDNGSLIATLLTIAGYTYGPLLALFAFGIFTKRHPKPTFIPLVCFVAPTLCYIIKQNENDWLGGYHIGVELLLLNAILTYSLLYLISINNSTIQQQNERTVI